MDEYTLAQKIAVWALPLIFGITLHEAAHGYVAHKLGDDTAYLMGRITLNPIKHIDPIGTVLLPLILLATNTGFIFGWAKPVPVNMYRLRKPRRDMALVGLAGPLSNLLMAIIWAALLKASITFLPHTKMVEGVVNMCFVGVLINIVLMVLNLIPIPPLDGSRFLSFLLPAKIEEYYNRLAPFGFIILIILIATNILSTVMMPVINFLQNLFRILFQY